MLSSPKRLPAWFTALLRHEARQLWQNRPACLVLVLLVAATAFLRWKEADPDRPRQQGCFIVYWQEDDWVKQLRKAASEEQDAELHITIVPVEDITGNDGLIRYPGGVHSIQIRPLSPGVNGRPGWLVWCWHAGSNPAALAPYTRWFWKVTGRHFNNGPNWDVRYSSLSPMATSPLASGSFFDTSKMPAHILQIGTLMLALFFCACYLPILGLSQDRAQQTILSVALTPAGWRGIAVAKWVFHFVLAMAAAIAVVAAAKPAALLSPVMWAALVAAICAYLGLGFVVSSLCTSVTAASAAMVGYGLLTAALVYGSVQLHDIWPVLPSASLLAVERNMFVILYGLWDVNSGASSPNPPLLALCGLASAWQIIGWLCYRGLRS